MLELLSPAGSPEAVVAAVQSGADAIYMGFGGFNARRGAKNFSDEEFDSAVRYCRVRGCKVYVTLNTLVSDRELEEAVSLAAHASSIGADAILVQDLGLARVLRCAVPDIALHASTQMSIHNLDGVMAAAELGMTRAVLARELSLEQIRLIAEKSPIELEVFVHGALCFCHSGQCYMSSLIGRRSGNRGACAQPCRLQYSLSGRNDDYPLSLRDNCLVSHLRELEQAGVSCVKIEGRMKRPEYVAIATGIYSKAIKDRLPPTDTEMQQLETAFSRQGFTDGYLTGQTGRSMFGVRGEQDKEATKLFAAVRREYGAAELRRVPVKFFAIIKAGEISHFAVEDTAGNKVLKDGPMPQAADNHALTKQGLSDQLYKTGGTPYYCSQVEAQLEEGLFLPASAINEMRRALLEQLTELRKNPPVRNTGKLPRTPQDIKVLGNPKMIFQVSSAEQLTEQLAQLKPDYLYVPLEILANEPKALLPFAQEGITPVAVLPRVIFDGGQDEKTAEMLRRVYAMGVRQALVGNMGHVRLARQAGMELRGDFGLNVYNSDALQVLNAAGFLSATASFELRLSQIRDMQKPINTELMVYGRLPLMISEQSLVRSGESGGRTTGAELSDRTGQIFPVLRSFGDRSVIYNTHKLFLADKKADYEACGIWGQRLLFTNEGAEECVRVAESYLGLRQYEPNAITRGLYYRGVE